LRRPLLPYTTLFRSDMHVEQDAGGRPASRNGQQRRAIREADHFVATGRQNHRECVAYGRIVVDDKNLTAGICLFSHGRLLLQRRRNNENASYDTTLSRRFEHPYLYGL